MNIKEIGKFVSAGKAEFKLTDHRTDIFHYYKVEKGDGNIWFVSLQLIADNEVGYGYIGLIKDRKFRHTKMSIVNEESISFNLFDLFFLHLIRGNELPDWLEFDHIGRCGKCGRKLTKKESKIIGLGPKCRGEK